MNFPIELIVYPLLTLALSAPLFYLLSRSGGERAVDFQRQFRRLLLIPGIAALILRGATSRGLEGLSLGFGRKPELLVVSLFLPLVVELFVLVLVIRFRLARLDSQVVDSIGGRIKVGDHVGMLLGSGEQSRGRFLLNLLGTVSAGAILMVFFSLAEEFGWRGYYQGLAIDTFGLVWGLMITGLAWGLWYLPLMAMGYQMKSLKRAGSLFLFPVFTISAAILAGYLYWLTETLWAPAFFNAGLKVNALLLPGAIGLAGDSLRVRIVWIWVWASLAGLALALWGAVAS